MNNGYEHASQYQLFLCAYPHGKRVMPLACERVITCRVRAFTLFPEIPWRVTIDDALNGTERHHSLTFYKNFKRFPWRIVLEVGNRLLDHIGCAVTHKMLDP